MIFSWLKIADDELLFDEDMNNFYWCHKLQKIIIFDHNLINFSFHFLIE